MMMSMRKPFRLLWLMMLVFAPAAGAQKIAYPGIAWGAQADSVRALLESRGFRADNVLDDGDRLFRGADSSWLRVDLRDERVIGVVVVDTTPPPNHQARFRALEDSLRAALGPPDETVEEPRLMHLWAWGLTSVELGTDGIGPGERVFLTLRGPGWYDEMGRRREDPAMPAGFTIVSESAFMRLAIDTTARARTAAGLRGRFRIQYDQPITPTLNGVAQDPMDAIDYEMEFDCAGRRARLIARATYLEGRRVASERPDSRAWSTPQPDGHYARGLDAVCRAARR